MPSSNRRGHCSTAIVSYIATEHNKKGRNNILRCLRPSRRQELVKGDKGDEQCPTTEARAMHGRDYREIRF